MGGRVAAIILVALVVGIGLGIALGPTINPPKTVEIPVGLSGVIQIGALLPLSGDLASYGEASKTTIQIAESEVNKFLSTANAHFTISIVIEDTETKPGPALDKLMSMTAKGIKIVIGPQTSAEVRNIKAYADANKLLLISQSSTAPELAIPDDYVYRFCPDDTIQGPAIATVMYGLGIRHLVTAWRGDAWGDGLQRTAVQAFQKVGGTVVEGVRYAPEAKEFSSEAKQLADVVAEQVKNYGKDKVAVLFIAFAEAVNFFAQAKQYQILSQVRWFGSDGTALLTEITKDANAAEFAVNTQFLNPIFAATKSTKYEQLVEKVKAEIGRSPDPYAVAAYDAAWVIALSLLATGKNDADAVISIMPTILNNYFGASGWIVLNDAGDRAFADYDLWRIASEDGKYEWVNVGTYVYTTKTVTWIT